MTLKKFTMSAEILASIVSLMALFAIGMFPNLVLSKIFPDYHLTI